VFANNSGQALLPDYLLEFCAHGRHHRFVKRLKIGVLGSGKGSNFEAIADACARGEIAGEVVLVISDVENAGILAKAKARGIPTKFLTSAKFKTKLEPEVEREYVAALQAAGADTIALAGFMRILKEDFLKAFAGRIINIHPSLLPAFPGLAGWKQAWEYGAKVSGCTVHFVDAGMDTGPIILQEAVPVLDNDTPETLHARIQKKEHALYVRALQLLAEEKLEVRGRRVLIKG
jgi:phosphoribosylglycinamide formyltransferase-1